VQMSSFLRTLAGSWVVKSEADLVELKRCLSLLMDPTMYIELDNVLNLKDIFQHDSGRRTFAQTLYTYFTPVANGKIPNFNLSASSFEGILYLINAMLARLDMQNGADYICAKIILEISKKIFHEVTDEKEQFVRKETVEDMIKTHYIFENVRFWEEYFWDTISRKFQKTGEEDYSKKEKNWLKKQLIKFTKTMNGWGSLTPDNIHEFAQEMASQIGMDESQKESLSSGVSKRVTKGRSRSDSAVTKMISPRDSKKSPRDTPLTASNKSSPRLSSPRSNSMSSRDKYHEKK